MQRDRSELEEPLRKEETASGRMSPREREEAFRSEREATRLDAGNPLAEAELRDWETTLEDGID